MSPLGGETQQQGQQQNRPDVAASSNSPVKDNNTLSSPSVVATPYNSGGGSTNRRAERKRQREKQRRTELSNAFDELSSFVVQLERDHKMMNQHPSNGYHPHNDPYNQHHHHPAVDTGITRLDLVGRALKMMKVIHEENEHNKRIIASYRLHEMGASAAGHHGHGHGPPSHHPGSVSIFVKGRLPR